MEEETILFRFKTEKEFRNEFGNSWRKHDPSCIWVNNMDEYFGKPISPKYNSEITKLFCGLIDYKIQIDWFFTKSMITYNANTRSNRM